MTQVSAFSTVDFLAELILRESHFFSWAVKIRPDQSCNEDSFKIMGGLYNKGSIIEKEGHLYNEEDEGRRQLDFVSSQAVFHCLLLNTGFMIL